MTVISLTVDLLSRCLTLDAVIIGGSMPPHLFHLQSPFLHFPPVHSSGGLGRARSPAAKHFDAIYTVKQPYKIHIDVIF